MERPGSGAALNVAHFRKELDELLKGMDLLSLQVESRVSDSIAAAASICASAQEGANEVSDRIKSLKPKITSLEKEELSKCEQQTSEIYTNLRDLHEHSAKLFQLKEDREGLIAKYMSELADKLSHKKQKVKALHEATGWYKRLLSLHCEYSDAVKFIFTNVDPRDADRVFSFSIRLDKSTKSWTMVDCNPWVEASGSFVELLNKNNELSRFVRSMRREFEVLAVRSRYLVK